MTINYSDGYSLRIFNMLGEVVYSNDVNSNTQPLTIDLTNLSNGIYMVSVTADGEVMSQRLEIQK